MLLSEEDGMGKRMTTAGAKCNADASVYISGAELIFSYLYFASTHLRVAVVFLSGICIQKAGIFPYKQNYPTSEEFSN